MSDISNIKSLSIVDFLAKRGYRWERNHEKNTAYLSPFRTEGSPSFIVNNYKNTWVDFGDSDPLTNHGDIISLVQRLDNVSFQEALALLEDKVYTPITYREPKVKLKSIEVVNIEKLADKSLIEYITQVRGINAKIADAYCKEVTYSFPSGRYPDAQYKAIGFENDLHGFELRSPKIKLSTDPKCFTTFDGDDSECNIFEGFISALSYLEYFNLDKFKEKTYVLNGAGMIHLLLPFLKGKVNLYVDNDRAGNVLVETIKESGLEYADKRGFYEYYNDTNDKLTAQ